MKMFYVIFLKALVFRALLIEISLPLTYGLVIAIMLTRLAGHLHNTKGFSKIMRLKLAVFYVTQEMAANVIMEHYLQCRERNRLLAC